MTKQRSAAPADAYTDRDYERLADLAEAGFDVSTISRNRGRPSLSGGGVSPRVAARVSPEVYDRAVARAGAEGRSLSEVIRSLLEDYASG